MCDNYGVLLMQKSFNVSVDRHSKTFEKCLLCSGVCCAW